MSFISRLFHKEEPKTGGMEDYMTLVRVYFQSAIASQVGITSLAMLPDLRAFKSTFHVATVNNKLGLGEKAYCKKMMQSIYQTEDDFFDEVDKSIRKNCRKMQDVQMFMYQFQGFSQELMMLVGSLMKFKLRVPSIFRKTLYTMTAATVNDIFDKNDFTDPSVVKSVMAVRKYDARLGFSRKWISDFIFQVVMLAKKERKPKDEAAEK